MAFPIVYYFVSYLAHYPAPLSWMLLLLAAYEVQGWFRGGGPDAPAGEQSMPARGGSNR